MRGLKRVRLKWITIALGIFVLLHLFGVFTHLFEKDFYTEFSYPYEGDIEQLVFQLKNNLTPHVKPINRYDFKYFSTAKSRCLGVSQLRLVYVIKSAPRHFEKRKAIRNTWGFERRFSDVDIRTVFLIGEVENLELQKLIDEESKYYHDIVQANFTDSYYNNTFKTMMGFHWAVHHCPISKFYMFVDDDYYVSTKNVLRFARNPVNYPKYLHFDDPLSKVKSARRYLQVLDIDIDDDARLYAGYVFVSSPHRHITSKWRVSLEEYPYHMWPPYVTAGAYILSKEALKDMFYTSFYTKHFRFDDIYVGLLAYKTKIEPFHSEEFHFYKKSYDPLAYKYTIASHGYDNPEYLVKVWTEQKGLGNA